MADSRAVTSSQPEPVAADSDEQRWLTAGVTGIGTASLLADVGHEIPTALLPSLLTSTLQAPAAALGVIEGVADGLAGVARFAGGALADDPQRRRAVAVGGYTATAVLSAGIAAAQSVWQVGLLRSGAWLARGLRVPARNALLADVVPASAYGRAYGFERAMDNLGAILGPLLALGLVAVVGVRWAIALSVIPGLLAAGAIVYAIRHTRRAAARPRTPIRFIVRPVLRGRLGRLLGAVAAFEVGNIAATLLILRATELLTPQHGSATATTYAIALYIGYNVAATLASIPAGRLADRLGATGPVVVLTGGVACFTFAYTGFALAPASVAVLALPFVLAGIGIGAVETAEHAAVAAMAPGDIRGSAFGMLAAVQSLGNLAASAIAGLLWTVLSPAVAFWYLVGWMLLALAGLAFTRR
ncbi:MFS transporter [Rhizocola hellebori]|uniref:MFS transporter n=1 Tax=Rhizocola hellebori TaxID=1392758 RepID=A0A8J3Q479_9ACTN|nr:MFS transporter [Rhizocola hellebori]GIH03633.1 MFS transporter [Rhizocola hellebori]